MAPPRLLVTPRSMGTVAQWLHGAPLILALTACADLQVPVPAALEPSTPTAPPRRRADIPAIVQPRLPSTEPAQRSNPDRFDIAVDDVDVRELLFAMARDAGINIDIHRSVVGRVTLNAVDQTFWQVIRRIAAQIDIRYAEIDGHVTVTPDAPYVSLHHVDYVNMTRDATATISINTQIASTAGTAPIGGGANTGLTGGGNSSNTRIENHARNRFWDSLEHNVRELLRQTEDHGSSALALPNRNEAPASTAEQPSLPDHGTFRSPPSPDHGGASVMINAETGTVVVRATARQHEKIREFLSRVAEAAQRQVMIEATVAEVRLSRHHQRGIDWNLVSDGGKGLFFQQAVKGSLAAASASSLGTLGYRSENISTSIKLLEAFGDVKVLSSPKLSVLNNQTALLKVVSNIIYFTVKSDTTTTTNSPGLTTTTTSPQSVSVGLVMSVTPQISDDRQVVLNIRPTISRVVSMRADPNPQLKLAGVENLVPEIETREMESVMRVSDGEIAVLGGLMQDEIDLRRDAVPGLASLPLIGPLFSLRNDTARKTELVIFLRPIVVDRAQQPNDRVGLARHLPVNESLHPPALPPASKTEAVQP